VSAELANHPRVFATLTAPSFGAVHRRLSAADRPCRVTGERASLHVLTVGRSLAASDMTRTSSLSVSRSVLTATTTPVLSLECPRRNSVAPDDHSG